MDSIFLRIIVFVSFTFAPAYCSTDCDKNLGMLNQTYNLEISRGLPALYFIPLNLIGIRNPDIPTLRFEATVDKTADPVYPVLFSASQFEEVTNFQLPYFSGRRGDVSSKLHYSGGRTLCTLKEYYSSARNITVRMTTSSPNTTRISFSLSISYEIFKANGHQTNFTLTPASPRVFKYFWKSEDDTNIRIVQVLVSSSDRSCATLSIQDPYCPVHDELENIEFDGYWQTMSTKGVMTISKRDFPEGFAIVIAQHKDESRCTSSNAGLVSSTQNQNFPGMLQEKRNFTQSKNISLVLLNRREFSMGLLVLALMIPVLFSFGIIFISCGLFQQRHNWLSKRTYDTMNTKRSNNNEADVETTIMLTTPVETTSTREETNETSMKRLRGKKAVIESSIWKVRADVNVMTLKKKEHRELMKDSNKFYWTIIIVSIFYAIPVYQLILNYLRIVKRTGEYDICYYNYLCAHRLWIFNDFNHFWSNVSYVIFGLAFNFIVGRRERNLKFSTNGSTNVKNQNQTTEEEGGAACCQLASFLPRQVCCAPIIHVKKDHGIPSHFGVYYAMGLALIMEGVLSAAYHLCPNQSNFQFDTCFMYVISVLTILKVYQFRHPIHIGANQTFAILAAFALISVIGLILEIYNGEDGSLVKSFRWTFIVIQLIAMFILSIHYYAIGYVKDDRGNAICGWSILLNLDQLPKTVQLDRLLFPILSIFLSLGVIIYSELTETHFATYLLYTLIANVLGSCIYYIGIMKPLHHEFQDFSWIQPAFYFLAAGVIGGISISYFLTELTRWEISPSQSRSLNEECSYSWFPFLPFYDNHDIWHFFSACSLFCAFMGLLIVDDDILTTPQTKIRIF